jgi:tRNA A-37 threonylcarbamoyl transferase component Bud32/tetratricopeptide (TPR) repeat protein/TolB-like protein
MEHEDRLRAALADRYAIEGEIGRGGMATVYLAQDHKHDRQVAVKVLDPDLAQSLGPERFLREIKTAANLSHPHILPLFDSGETGGFLFYVMPFVKGESLRSRLDRERQLPVEDAVQITREIADALAYAHEEGVIHRDVKPANIMLEAGHAVLADFGVAHAVAQAKDERLTRTGTSLGTPAYMSPEQATAEEGLDGRSDQYALGCVLFEMLAGHPPFTGAQVEAVVRQHLTEQPPSVTQARPSVAEEVVKVINRALSKSPADRFKSTGEMAAALAFTTAPPQTKGPSGRAKALIYAATFVLGLATIAVIATMWPGASPTLEEDRVAVFPFENLTGDPAFDDLGQATAHVLTAGLDQTEEVRAIPTDAVVRGVQAYGEGADLAEVATSLQAGITVTGVMTLRGDQLEIQAQLTTVAEQEILESVEGSGPASDPMAAVEDVRGRVMSALAIALGEKEWSRIVTKPPAYEALRAYQRGAELFVTTGFADARPHLEEAFRLDPAFASPLLHLTAGYGNAGRWAEADSVLALLEPHRHELGRYDALTLEYFLARNAGDNRSRLEAARAMSVVDPYTAGYTHGNAAMFMGRPREALEALTRTDPDDPLWNTWVGYWSRLAQAHFALDQYEEELEAARRAKERFPRGRPPLRYEIQALVALGRVAEIGPLLDDIEALGSSLTHDTYMDIVGDLFRFGHADLGEALAQRTLDWCLDRDPEGFRGPSAAALMTTGRPEEALPLVQSLVDESPNSVGYRGFLGIVLAMVGDVDGAEAQERWLAELDRPFLLGLHSYWRAAVLAHLDRKEEAVPVLRDAFDEGRSFNERTVDLNLRPLWFYEPFERLVAPKG